MFTDNQPYRDLQLTCLISVITVVKAYKYQCIFIGVGISVSVSYSSYCFECFFFLVNREVETIYSTLLKPVHPHLSTLNRSCPTTLLSLPGTRVYVHIIILLLDLMFLRGYLHLLWYLTQ